MPIKPGTHTLGPENATLCVRTGKAGAASKAGHNLLIEVTSWNGTLQLADGSQPSVATLTADSGSLRVLEGTGGMLPLGDDDKLGIKQTIDKEVLKGTPIEFRSSAVAVDPERTRIHVEGEVGLAGARQPLTFELSVEDRRLTGTATIRQSAWGIKPYSALFGTLKVADEVVVELDAVLTDG